jgi:hypothetical protein
MYKIFIGFIVGLLFAAATTYAWGAVWNDTNSWISTGDVIGAQEMAENFEYLLKIQGDMCTTHNQGVVRYVSGVLEYCNNSVWEGI